MKFIKLATASITEKRILELSSLTQDEIDGVLLEIKEYGYIIEWQDRNRICVSRHPYDE